MHVMGKLADIMLGKVIMPKYLNLGSLVVAIIINGVTVQNALIDLGLSINVMIKDIMQHMNLTNIRPTHIVLQLANSSIVKPDGMMEDILVALDSWEYPIDFMILSPKDTLGGYPIILGR